jgi:hypothetical protein
VINIFVAEILSIPTDIRWKNKNSRNLLNRGKHIIAVVGYRWRWRYNECRWRYQDTGGDGGTRTQMEMEIKQVEMVTPVVTCLDYNGDQVIERQKHSSASKHSRP